MERMFFDYSISDDGRVDHSASMSFTGDYIGLDDIANKLKDFLNAAGYSVVNVAIDTGEAIFTAVDVDDEE